MAAHEPLVPERYTTILKQQMYQRYACRATSAHELDVWQRSFRPALREAIGLGAIAQHGLVPLDPRQESEETLDDHVRELWTIESEPGFRLPFYLLRPLEAVEPLPLVLTPHGHGKGAKATYVGIAESEEEQKAIEQGERDIARQAVRAGHVAIAPDMRGFGALRRQIEKDEDATCSCAELQKYAMLFGRTLIGERVWDIGRLIDYAATRPEIDDSRIVITGNSGGGMISVFAAACDERISISAPGSYFCTFEHSIGSMRHCPCNFVPGMLTMGEMHDVAGLIAPRPFLAVNGVEDPIFPIDATRAAHERLREIYALLGAEDRCRLYEGDGGHRYYKQPVWPFVEQFIGASATVGHSA